METLKDRLSRVMEAKGLKQADIVRRTGISKGLVSLLLSVPGKDLLASNLMQLGKAVGEDPIWLYTGKSSAVYAEQMLQNLNRVPVVNLKQIDAGLLDMATLMDADEYIHSEFVGKLIGIRAADNALKESGVAAGDVCIIDLAIDKPEDGDIVLAFLRETEQLYLLKAVRGLTGMTLAVDDPRISALDISKALVYGVMIEVRKRRQP